MTPGARTFGVDHTLVTRTAQDLHIASPVRGAFINAAGQLVILTQDGVTTTTLPAEEELDGTSPQG